MSVIPGSIKFLIVSQHKDLKEMTNSRITRIACSAILCWCFALAFVPAASAQVVDVRVDIDSTAMNPDGSTWTDAFKYLQDALHTAGILLTDPEISTVRIWVAEDTYLPTQADVATLPSVGDDREHTFNLIPHVEIYGGFDGTEEELHERDPETNITILSGDLDEDDEFNASYTTGGILSQLTFDNYVDNSFHVVTADSPNMGIPTYPPPPNSEGKYCTTCDDEDFFLATDPCSGTFSYFCDCDTEAACWEFGFCCPDICTSSLGCASGRCAEIVDSSAILDGFTIRGGSASGSVLGVPRRGAGIRLVNSSPRILNCIIEQNRAIGTLNAVGGGGVYVLFEDWPPFERILRFEGCVIRHNGALSNGGGIHVDNLFSLCEDEPIDQLRDLQRTALIDCTISENKAGVFGAGVYADTHSIVDLVNSSIVRNVIGVPRPEEGVVDSDGVGVYAGHGALRRRHNATPQPHGRRNPWNPRNS